MDHAALVEALSAAKRQHEVALTASEAAHNAAREAQRLEGLARDAVADAWAAIDQATAS